RKSRALLTRRASLSRLRRAWRCRAVSASTASGGGAIARGFVSRSSSSPGATASWCWVSGRSVSRRGGGLSGALRRRRGRRLPRARGLLGRRLPGRRAGADVAGRGLLAPPEEVVHLCSVAARDQLALGEVEHEEHVARVLHGGAQQRLVDGVPRITSLQQALSGGAQVVEGEG